MLTLLLACAGGGDSSSSPPSFTEYAYDCAELEVGVVNEQIATSLYTVEACNDQYCRPGEGWRYAINGVAPEGIYTLAYRCDGDETYLRVRVLE